MSEDEKGFLARWSQRKREADKATAKPAPDESAEQTVLPADSIAAGETEAPFDLASLPKLEELTANTDMTVFFKKGVPDSIRNAALRKSWALDPAIRNYVNPALDYAYDWNTPGGVPGSGELAPGTDIARMVSQIMGGGERPSPSQQSLDNQAHVAERQQDDASGDVEGQTQPPDMSAVQSVRLSQAQSPDSLETEARVDATSAGSAVVASGGAQAGSQDGSHSSASQQDERRHGSARPK